RCDDRVVECHVRDLAVYSDPQRRGVLEAPSAPQVTDLAPARDLAKAAGHLAHDLAVLPLAQPVEVDRRFAEGEADVGGLARVGDQLRRVEQRLRGDAPLPQADAAGRLAVVN